MMTTQSRFELIGFTLAAAESPAKLRRKAERRARWQEYQQAKDAYDDLTFPEFLRWVAAGRPSLEISWDWLGLEDKP